MSSKKKHNKKDKKENINKNLEKVEENEETSEIIKDDENEDDSESTDESESIDENEDDSERIDKSESIDENEDDSENTEDIEEDSDEEEDIEEEKKEDTEEKGKKEISEEEKSEKSKDTQKEKKRKEVKEDSDEPDYFWVKVLVVTIVIVWVALIAGSWAGNYFLKSEFFKRYNSQVVDDNKPKVWKTIVEVDKSGAVSKSAVLADNTDDLQIDDFRNTNEPIPGIDDQSLKNLKDIEPLQEPSDDSSAIEIQIASEETMDGANKIAEDLKSKGYNPAVEPFTENGTNKYRVKISETSAENANKKIEELKSLNYNKAFIIGK